MKSILVNFLLKKVVFDTVDSIIRYEKDSGEKLSLYDYVSVYRTNLRKSLVSKLENTTPILYSTSEYKFISNPEYVLYRNGIPHDLRQSRGGYEEKYYQALLEMLLDQFPEYVKEDESPKSWSDLDTAGLTKLVNEARNNKSMWEV